MDELFAILDVTGEVQAKQAEVITSIAVMRVMLQGDLPQIDIGPHCSDPYECSFCGHCWQHIPENSVFDFSDHGRPDSFALYQQGILKMEDVQVERLKWRQKLQLDGLLHQKNHVDVPAVQDFLDSLWYPLCFMDFETTYMTPVPLFDGTHPYQQVPFQFSLHILEKPGSELRHHEFLAPSGSNPQISFLQSLLAVVPKVACILAWNQVFEKSRLHELAETFPDYRQEVYALTENIRDLMSPFRSKYIYHWQFDGSYSIKAVLPALVPELSYKGLAVNNGEMAANTWQQMRYENDEGRIAELRLQLLEYCHLDTLAMVRILEKMREMVGGFNQ
ncbi:MAG: DUF2779 domain-containing protein [Desulfuromonadaceae bacterium]|nr:DUF2779 domain-containing protein [Desulfuromonadaceae bacterium]MDD2854836.1 DUF2779 domain-containing protein [Desulfuromonadaceae bacterium]